jgi:phosphoribosylformylglycinamidine (FGAM) synthase PurS component
MNTPAVLQVVADLVVVQVHRVRVGDVARLRFAPATSDDQSQNLEHMLKFAGPL